MKNTKFIAANWKMNKTTSQTEKFIDALICKSTEFNCDVLICPPFLSIPTIIDRCHLANVLVGAQNCHWESSGAFTGEISAPMLSDIGVDYVVLGHSERRTCFCETDEMIAKKVTSVLNNHLKLILCVGETLAQRNCGKESEVVINQLKIALNDLQSDELKNIVIAYEPVWAIGTGETSSPRDAAKLCSDIRTFVASKYGSGCADSIRILYGGSLTSKNAESFLSTSGIDGALVGGASLEAEEFLKIINIAEKF